MTDTLLAKSQREAGRQSGAVSLRDHTRVVVAAARMILDEVRGFLPANIDPDKLRDLTLVAATLHDIGKANSIFLGKMEPLPTGFARIPSNLAQPLRHESISALIVVGYAPAAEAFAEHLRERVFAEWDDPEQACWMLAWTIGGHHLQMHHAGDDSAGMVRISGIPPHDIAFCGDLLCAELREEFRRHLHATPAIPDFRIGTDVGVGDDHHAALLENFAWESEERAESLAADDMRLLAFAKAILIAADVAGSALWDDRGDQITRLEHGVRTSLRNCCGSADLEAVVRARLQVDARADHGSRLFPFQRDVRDAIELRVVLEAACGGGKTIAAYEWARRHVSAGRKLILCYPTTGTAAAGFDDYLLTQGEIERKLVTSRADVDIQRMLANQPETEAGDRPRELRHPDRDSDLEDLMKQESLQAWGQQAIAATADFVLGLMQNHRRGLFSWPVIAKSAIVFDEIHSYDAKMFGTLIRFLQAFPKVPALLMTASLQPARRDALKAAGVVYRLIGGNPDAERAARYCLEWSTEGDPVPGHFWKAVADTVGRGGKVLWVCNTVAAAVDVYRTAATELAVSAKRILFHSRFCYRHRVERQDLILRSFRAGQPGCLAVTTQVCEMSLDISADLLVTSIAPFPALMQRLGRLNRRLEHPGGAPGLIHDDDCRDGRPYRRADLAAAREAVQVLAQRGAPASQRDLKDTLDAMNEAVDDIKFHSAWLDGGWESQPATLREGDATVPVLLAQHEETIRRRIAEAGTGMAVKEWLVPILQRKGVHVVGKIGGYPLVSGVDYDEEVGAR